jgi:hypothetical protein
MSTDRRGTLQKHTGRETYLGGQPVKASAAIGQYNLVGLRDDGGVEDYDPAAVTADGTYAYVAAGVATANIAGGAGDGDVVTDKNLVFGGLFLFTTNADIDGDDVGALVYGEDSFTVKAAAVADGIVVGRLMEYNGDNTGWVLVEQYS